jgi:hypothetical protein
MPTLGNALDFAKYEARNIRSHQLGSAPSSPVTGQLYYNTSDNTLYWWDGTTWQSAKGGTGTPTGPAGGDLTGTYPNPQIAAGVITDVDVNAANKDGAVGTPSLRTLGAGAAQAMPGNRTLDAINSPTSSVNMNGQRLNLVGTPTLGTDAANKSYVDALASGIDAKQSVKCATTGNIGLNGLTPCDGVTPADGDRVLVKDQTNPAQNGIYWAAPVAWQRVDDADTWNEHPGAHVFVEQGTTQADTGWVCTADAGGTLGTTALPWVQFSAAGQIQGGAGLSKTGNTLDVGAGAGIQVNADTVQVANNGITNAMIADGAVDLATADVTGVLPLSKGGTGYTGPNSQSTLKSMGGALYYSTAIHGAGTTIVIDAAAQGHRASRGLLVQVQDEATGNVEIPDISVSAAGIVTITFGVSVAANSKRITVIG